MTMKNLICTLMAAVIMMAGCHKPDTPQQTEPEPDQVVPEAIGKYIFNGNEYPIYTALYAYNGNSIMIRVSPLKDLKRQTTYAIIGINSSLEGKDINVGNAWHNDDYYFRYEDPVRYYSEYRKLHSGSIFIQRKGMSENTFDIKADLILPDGTDFSLELLSAELEPYPQAVD